MNNDKLLEELRAQRELIQKHLQWLNENIAALDNKEATSETTDKKLTSKLREAASEKLAAPESAATPEILNNDELDKEFGKYKAPAGNDFMRAKIGCLVLFVLSTLLFLFLLFGLPYLLD
ncbi:hypothetical protein DDZ13_07990 [Coraliomargarita sinensis]|uniref:Uncharacterized protein n=1 Tax=Coraliomargarita sinensis TaxID=2174842 RepID=A0A317ZGA7_9BACT|nr:hypothetical protein [Coraliomargarita sinensis]PXA04460.1 hypothetical protein DDZ13_07990 [Coraliomargarita sinensis]